MGPKSSNSCPYKETEKGRHTQRRPCKDRARDWCYAVTNQEESPKAGKGNFFPRVPWKKHSPAHRVLASRIRRKKNFCGFMPLSLWQFFVAVLGK